MIKNLKPLGKLLGFKNIYKYNLFIGKESLYV